MAIDKGDAFSRSGSYAAVHDTIHTSSARNHHMHALAAGWSILSQRKPAKSGGKSSNGAAMRRMTYTASKGFIPQRVYPSSASACTVSTGERSDIHLFFLDAAPTRSSCIRAPLRYAANPFLRLPALLAGASVTHYASRPRAPGSTPTTAPGSRQRSGHGASRRRRGRHGPACGGPGPARRGAGCRGW
jgi:hypothetical protein